MHDNKRKSLDKNTKCSLKVTALCAKGSDNEKKTKTTLNIHD